MLCLNSKRKIRDLDLKHVGWQDDGSGFLPDEMIRGSAASWKANNQEERTLLLGSGHEPKRYDHVHCDSMPASGRFEAHILGKQDAQNASHDIFRPTSRFSLSSVLARRSVVQTDAGPAHPHLLSVVV